MHFLVLMMIRAVFLVISKMDARCFITGGLAPERKSENRGRLCYVFCSHSGISDGWVCFVVSITLIGVLTALIGDFSSHLGCTVGLKDTVTAIAFVALGTSIPGDGSSSDGGSLSPRSRTLATNASLELPRSRSN